MIKRLIRHGNSFVLLIDRPILDLLKIRPDTPLEITTNGEHITVAVAPRTKTKRRATLKTKRR
jgi:antitoxin MazE